MASAHTEQTPLLEEKVDKITLARQVLTGVAPCLLLYAVGVLALMHFEGWDFLLSNYVMVQVVTTIGYGDFTVQSPGAKVFMAFYVLFVLVVLAFYFQMFVGTILDWESKILRKHLRSLEQMRYSRNDVADTQIIKDYGPANQALASAFMFLQVLLFGTVFFRYMEHCTCSYGPNVASTCKDDTFEHCVATGGYVKDWASAFYMSAITLTTIGFGDYQPRTVLGRLLGMIWMVLGVAATALFLSSFSSYLFEKTKKDKYCTVDTLDITDNVFDEMDMDKSGTITRGEYLAFTLVKYGVCPKELMKEINEQYDRIDGAKANSVTREALRKHRRGNVEGLSASA